MFNFQAMRRLASYGRSNVRHVLRPNGFFHYHAINFDTKQALPHDAIQTLVSEVARLRTVGIEAVVAGGTLLGIVREGALIPHDTDLDLYVIGASKAAAAVECLEAAGWTVGQHARIGSVSSHVTFYNEQQVLLDLTFFEVIGGQLMSFKERDGYLVIDAGIMTPPRVASQYTELLLPNLPETLLAAYYGQNWRTPKTKKTFWKDEYCGIYVDGVADIAAERKRIIRASKKDSDRRASGSRAEELRTSGEA